jgi:hypothetical protein
MKNHKARKIRKTSSRAWFIMTILVSTVILAFVVGTIVSSKTASAKQVNVEQAQSVDNDATVQFANQKIKIDPRTGKLRTPTAAEARAIVETVQGLTNRSSKGLQVVRDADGTTKVDLQGRFQTVVLAKPNPDGTNEIRCVTSLEEATAFLGIDASKIPATDK